MSVEDQLTRVLGAWAAASVVAGLALSMDPRTRGFGRQTAAWGAVDGAIAVVVQGAFLLVLDTTAARRLG